MPKKTSSRKQSSKNTYAPIPYYKETQSGGVSTRQNLLSREIARLDREKIILLLSGFAFKNKERNQKPDEHPKSGKNAWKMGRSIRRHDAAPQPAVNIFY